MGANVMTRLSRGSGNGARRAVDARRGNVRAIKAETADVR